MIQCLKYSGNNTKKAKTPTIAPQACHQAHKTFACGTTPWDCACPNPLPLKTPLWLQNASPKSEYHAAHDADSDDRKSAVLRAPISVLQTCHQNAYRSPESDQCATYPHQFPQSFPSPFKHPFPCHVAITE